MASYPPPLAGYGDAALSGIWAKLVHRVSAEPFNLIASLIFLGAIVHTFLVARFRHLAHHFEHQHEALDTDGEPRSEERLKKMAWLRFWATVFHFLGEVEAVFGIWLFPLFYGMWFFKDLPTAVHYLNDVNYAEPIFVTVIMFMAATRPIILLAERGLAVVAKMLGGSGTAWWLAIMTGGPLLGSLITEPAAMTLCALLLGKRFYAQAPSMRLRYATLGLLFVNISVGGTLTHFAAPPVVMVASKWDWGFVFMIGSFGWKAVVGIVLSNASYWLVFRRELAKLKATADENSRLPIPIFVTVIHLLFLVWTVLNAHYTSLVVMGALFFLAWIVATEPHQEDIGIRGPLLVGFFLAGLVAHGGCQQWWIEPVLSSLGEWPLMIGSVALTAFNDNAAITYLASLVPGFSPELKYAVVAGAVTGGGLTVIANAPNPAGQSLLAQYFGEDGISPAKLFVSALVPTIIVGAAFMLL
ncbi:MAG: putative Na+/H+ antiporter [Chthoniobacteraceae bacterium]